jgi:hypothetical protein
MKLLVMQLSPPSRHLIPLRSKTKTWYIIFYFLSAPAEPPAPTCIAACFSNFLPSDMVSAVTILQGQTVIPSRMHFHLEHKPSSYTKLTRNYFSILVRKTIQLLTFWTLSIILFLNKIQYNGKWKMQLFVTLDKAKPDTENITGLNLAAVMCTAVQVTRLSLLCKLLVTRA